MVISKKNRARILSVASWLDSMAASLRRLARRTTPKRNKAEAEEMKL